MTFSLVARDADAQTFGAATASKYLAVGATVPAVVAGVGALVTQAHTNVTYRDRGLRSLRDGLTAARTVDLLVEADPGRDLRQVAVVAASGEAAAWTGSACSPAAGHLLGDGCVAVGNLLAGTHVLEAMMEAYGAAAGSLATRLVAGLAAGEAVGGDRRGRQSAAVVVASGEAMIRLRTTGRVDLRVDDHTAPVAELQRLLGRHELLVGEADASKAVPLLGRTAREVDEALEAGGYRAGSLTARLAAWAHAENLEHRLLDGAIDVPVLGELQGWRRQQRSPGAQ